MNGTISFLTDPYLFSLAYQRSLHLIPHYLLQRLVPSAISLLFDFTKNDTSICQSGSRQNPLVISGTVYPSSGWNTDMFPDRYFLHHTFLNIPSPPTMFPFDSFQYVLHHNIHFRFCKCSYINIVVMLLFNFDE